DRSARAAPSIIVFSGPPPVPRTLRSSRTRVAGTALSDDGTAAPETVRRWRHERERSSEVVGCSNRKRFEQIRRAVLLEIGEDLGRAEQRQCDESAGARRGEPQRATSQEQTRHA